MRALVAISISREWVESSFLKHLSTILIPEGWKISYGWLDQFTAAERHNAALNVSEQYDRLLFMDTDEIYPIDYYVKMLEHDEPLVTAMHVARYHPYDIVAYRVRDTLDVVNEMGKTETLPLFESVKDEEIMEMEKDTFLCDMTGTGALMIDPKILKDIEKPYFKDVYNEDGHRVLCDDFYFLYKTYQAGYRVLVDTRITPGHIAKVIAKPYNAADLRRAWEKVNSGHGYWKDGKK
jgi:hypothetical protein